MELKIYFNAIKRYWWMIAIAFVVTLSATWFFVSGETPVYEARATYVMRPRASIVVEEDVVRAVETLSRRIEINTTYAEIASSRFIRNQAIERLGLSETEREGLSVSGRVIAGTNVMEITASGPEPEILPEFANAVGVETILYVRNLYDVFELEPLDAATTPRNPVYPQTTLILALGAVVGLGLGVGLVILVEYLKGPTSPSDQIVLVEEESGLYSRDFFLFRMQEELNRSRRYKYPLALAIIRFSSVVFDDRMLPNPAYSRTLRRLREIMRRTFYQEDLIGRIDENTFAILMLDANTKDTTQSLVSLYESLVGSNFSTNHLPRDLYCAIGFTMYSGEEVTDDEFFRQATIALDLAEEDYAIKVRSYENVGQKILQMQVESMVEEPSG